MKFDKGIFFIFSVATFCILLAFVAGQANADEKLAINSSVSVESGFQEASVTTAIDPVQSIIIKQLAAIKSRDAGQAFSLISESMHNKYKNPKNFLGHMRFEFRTLYNHSDYTFLDRHELPNAIIQKVQIKTPENDPVLVIYKLEKADTGSWVIDSFSIIGGGETQPI